MSCDVQNLFRYLFTISFFFLCVWSVQIFLSSYEWIVYLIMELKKFFLYFAHKFLSDLFWKYFFLD